ADHGSNECERLALEGVDQILVKLILGIEALVRIISAQIAQIQPVAGEALDKTLTTAAIDQPIGFTTQRGGITQPFGAGKFNQPRVGPGVREEMRQPVSNAKIVRRL